MLHLPVTVLFGELWRLRLSPPEISDVSAIRRSTPSPLGYYQRQS